MPLALSCSAPFPALAVPVPARVGDVRLRRQRSPRQAHLRKYPVRGPRSDVRRAEEPRERRVGELGFRGHLPEAGLGECRRLARTLGSRACDGHNITCARGWESRRIFSVTLCHYPLGYPVALRLLAPPALLSGASLVFCAFSLWMLALDRARCNRRSRVVVPPSPWSADGSHAGGAHMPLAGLRAPGSPRSRQTALARVRSP